MTQQLESSVRERSLTLLSEVPWPAIPDAPHAVHALPSPAVNDVSAGIEASEDCVRIDDLVIDVAGREVSYRARTIELTHLEFDLLLFLARHRGRVFTREQLIENVWTASTMISQRTVDIHVHRLRTKLGTPWDRWLATVRRVGYKLSVRPAFSSLPERG